MCIVCEIKKELSIVGGDVETKVLEKVEKLAMGFSRTVDIIEEVRAKNPGVFTDQHVSRLINIGDELGFKDESGNTAVEQLIAMLFPGATVKIVKVEMPEGAGKSGTVDKTKH